jgi:hypothetical protein
MRIAIAGDSFAANYPNTTLGWPNILAQRHEIINLAQAGVSEYKIFKQVKTLDLKNFDCIIVSHTSFSRIHVPCHPIHKLGLHKNCDLIFSDVESKNSFFNSKLNVAKKWFKFYYDNEYQKDIYNLLRSEINKIITIPYLSIDNLEINENCVREINHLDLTKFWQNNRGSINHYTVEANRKIYEMIEQSLTNLH